VIFPAVAADLKATVDDLPILGVEQLAFTDGGYTLNGTGGSVLAFAGTTDRNLVQVVGSNTISSSLHIWLTGANTIEVHQGTLTIAGSIEGPGSLTKTGTGTLTFFRQTSSTVGVNTYAGGTTVQAGIVQVGAEGVLPKMGAVTVAAGATLDLNNFRTEIGSLEGAGSVTLGDVGGGRVVTGFNNQSTTFSGVISGRGDTPTRSGGLLKEGDGTFTLSGANTYIGSTWVEGGILQLGAAHALPEPAHMVVMHGTLDLAGFDLVTNFISSAATDAQVTLGSGTLTTSFGTLAGPITGTGGLVLNSSGMDIAPLWLTADNTYTGPTAISSGVVQIDGTQPNSPVTVGATATLRGTGTVGMLTVQGELWPGGLVTLPGAGWMPPSQAAVPGTLHSGSVVFNAGSSFKLQIAFGNVGDNSRLDVTGTVDLSGGPTLNRVFSPLDILADTLTVITGTAGITGTFADLPEGTKVFFGDQPYQIHYTASAVTLDRVFSANELVVAHIYEDLLGRAPDPIGRTYWSFQLDHGAMTPTQVALGIEASPEYRNNVVQGLYQQLLHRVADPFGLNVFVSLLGAGGTARQVEALILGSTEYCHSQGGGTNAGFVTALYADILHRTPDDFGMQVFSQALGNGVTPQQVADLVFSSDEYVQATVEGLYARLLHRQADPFGMDVFSAAMQQGMSEEAILASIIGSGEYLSLM
jgi:autotransporter-associated beta strand protein